MKINNIQNFSFKARLLTKPENFVLPTDSDEDKKYIENVFKQTDILLKTKQISKFTQNDTIEFERKKSKKKFVYNFVYKSPEINERIGNLEIDAINLKSAFNIKEIFRNITLMVAYKRGIFQQLPLFATDTQLRDKTFEYTKEQSENFPF